MFEALQFEFMRNALYAGLLASVLCGVMGTLVVVNRIVFLSGGIAHAAYGGIGLALYFGWPFLLGTTSFSFVAALIIARYRGVTFFELISPRLERTVAEVAQRRGFFLGGRTRTR